MSATTDFAFGLVMIQTKFLGPTNTKGSRIRAWARDGFSLTIPYPHELTGLACHYYAAQQMIERHKLDWIISDGGWLPNGDAAFTLNR